MTSELTGRAPHSGQTNGHERRSDDRLTVCPGGGGRFTDVGRRFRTERGALQSTVLGTVPSSTEALGGLHVQHTKDLSRDAGSEETVICTRQTKRLGAVMSAIVSQ
jgi:hypothetical protein